VPGHEAFIESRGIEEDNAFVESEATRQKCLGLDDLGVRGHARVLTAVFRSGPNTGFPVSVPAPNPLLPAVVPIKLLP
jgi:hypothetical protein